MKFETVYKRRLNISYMILWGAMECPQYEILMQQKNQIQGLLKLEVIVADGVEQYWYDITGKRSLDVCIRKEGLGGRMLLQLLHSLDRTVEEAGRYLLSEERISLEPEYIYLDSKEENVFFTYCPAVKKGEGMQLQELMEYLLQKIDHADPLAVKAGYEIYQKSVEPNSSLHQILAEFRETEQSNSVEHDQQRDSGQRREQDQIRVKEQRTREEQRPDKECRPDKERRPDKECRTSKKQDVVRSGVEKWKKAAGSFLQKQKKREKNKDISKGIVFEPGKKKEEDVMESNPTMYLGAVNKNGEVTLQGILKYQGSTGQTDLCIDREVYMIGSRREGVDGLIHSDSVSRIHAKVEHEPDGYYIEDLNSCNGTMVNGRLLDYKEKTKLVPGDQVDFASERYCFH